MKQFQPHRSSVGDVAANFIAVLCYLLMLIFWTFGLVPVLIIFLVEKKSQLVRFHAVQAMLLWLLRSLVGGDIYFEGLAAAITGNMAYLENPLGWGGDMSVIVTRVVISGIIVLLVLLCAVNAYYWRAWRLPLVGHLAQFICKHSKQAAYTGQGPVPANCRMAPPREMAWEGEPPPTAKQAAKPAGSNGMSGRALAATGAIDIAQLVAGLEARQAEAGKASAETDEPDMAGAPKADEKVAAGSAGKAEAADEAWAQVEAETKTETKAKVEAETETEIETKAQAETETETKAQGETETKVQVETETETETPSQVETEIETETETETATDAVTEAQPETETTVQADESAVKAAASDPEAPAGAGKGKGGSAQASKGKQADGQAGDKPKGGDGSGKKRKPKGKGRKAKSKGGQ